MSRLTSSLALTICMYAVAADAASRATGEKPPVVLPSGQKMSGAHRFHDSVSPGFTTVAPQPGHGVCVQA